MSRRHIFARADKWLKRGGRGREGTLRYVEKNICEPKKAIQFIDINARHSYIAGYEAALRDIKAKV